MLRKKVGLYSLMFGLSLGSYTSAIAFPASPTGIETNVIDPVIPYPGSSSSSSEVAPLCWTHEEDEERGVMSAEEITALQATLPPEQAAEVEGAIPYVYSEHPPEWQPGPEIESYQCTDLLASGSALGNNTSVFECRCRCVGTWWGKRVLSTLELPVNIPLQQSVARVQALMKACTSANGAPCTYWFVSSQRSTLRNCTVTGYNK